MEMKWLEDFLSVAETGSFTRSAQARYLTQPALSRRIRSLEQWAGASLIDRSSYPTRLTPAGELFRKQAIAILDQLHGARALMRPNPQGDQRALRFALPHALSLNFMPRWLTRIRKEFGPISTRVTAGNVLDAVLSLIEGNSDLLICYHHPAHPIDLSPREYPYICLGCDQVRPYARCDRTRTPMHALPGTPKNPIPLLNYSPDTYLRRIVDSILDTTPHEIHVHTVHETAMAEGLKNMMLEGCGIAFLPDNTAESALREGKIKVLGDDRLSAELEIRIYRTNRSPDDRVLALWDTLSSTPRR